MESQLKTQTVHIESLGRSLDIRELSARAQIEIIEAARDEKGMEVGAIACRHGVPEWADESVEDILANVPMRALNEIAEKIYQLSGVDAAKNSESGQNEDSSSDLPLN